jgi:hypothetical protein
MNIKEILLKGIDTCLEFSSILSAPVISRMAQSGAGTNRCLNHKCLPLPVHFYSPIPDIDDLERRHIWEKKNQLIGIDFQIGNQVTLLHRLGEKFGDECKWPLLPTNDPARFYINNNSFSFGCAAILHSMIRYYKPKRIIEIGSGNSSRIIAEAIKTNKTENFQTEYIIIDPFPSQFIRTDLPTVSEIIVDKVENVDENIFFQLAENDILFIDSGHVVKTGGDVNYLILEILPRIRPGVIIHFHDIPLPCEYPKIYFTNPAFRVFWTEAYLLQAFLSLNPYFEVLLGMNYLMTEKIEDFRKSFPHYNPEIHKSVSGSFWIQRKTITDK